MRDSSIGNLQKIIIKNRTHLLFYTQIYRNDPPFPSIVYPSKNEITDNQKIYRAFIQYYLITETRILQSTQPVNIALISYKHALE